MLYLKLLIFFLLSGTFITSARSNDGTDGQIRHVCFSPEGHCVAAIINEIKKAKSEILVQAYSFTSREIANALIDANKSGIFVAVIFDKSQPTENSSVIFDIRNAGLATYVDHCCAIAHNKVIIIDRSEVITGSYNFTKAAESKNAENLIIFEDPAFAALYWKNWQRHRDGAENLSLR